MAEDLDSLHYRLKSIHLNIKEKNGQIMFLKYNDFKLNQISWVNNGP